MIAKDLISEEIVPLRTSDTGDDALAMMSDFHVRHLPIVNDRQLLGLISEDEIFDYDTEAAIGSYKLKMNQPFVSERDHIYQIMRLMNDLHLSLIPVVDKAQNYMGVVTLEDLLKYFAESASFGEHGSVIVLEVNRYNYSLSQIARIVESENVLILNSFITSSPDSSELEITLKLNRPDIAAVITAFRRYGYDIKASFSELEYMDSLQEHYDSLMTYLSV
jgi:predicted transcriptional regulator